MVRRHPALSIATSAYGVALVAVSLLPLGDSGGLVALLARRGITGAAAVAIETIACFVAFMPLGALVTLLVGRSRWPRALAVVALAAIWIDLAMAVWTPARQPDLVAVVAQVAGGAVGAVLIGLVSRPGAERRAPSLNRVGGPAESSLPRP